ncbi:MAG: hypothetical protein WC451_06830 [Patescibacteria group bacterium]
MKINIKILLTISLGVCFASLASAASLDILPATSTVDLGKNMTATAVVQTSGEKICAVQGTIVFNNLTCQSITLASGMMAQTQPTCSNPNFVVGIPKCVTTDTTLFTVVVKPAIHGVASINFTGVDLISTGTSISTASAGGKYIINEAPIVVTKTQETESAQEVSTSQSIETQEPSGETKQSTAEEVNSILSENEAQTAAISQTSVAQSFFTWIWVNIVWILTVIFVGGGGFITGRKTCKK